MTNKELSQVYHMRKEIAKEKARLAELRAKKSERTRKGSKRYEQDIRDTIAIIDAKISQCMHERLRIERYIADIPDSLTRQILTLYYIEGLNWIQVAREIGGITPDAARMIRNRYLQDKKENTV